MHGCSIFESLITVVLRTLDIFCSEESHFSVSYVDAFYLIILFVPVYILVSCVFFDKFLHSSFVGEL